MSSALSLAAIPVYGSFMTDMRNPGDGETPVSDFVCAESEDSNRCDLVVVGWAHIDPPRCTHGPMVQGNVD